MERGRGARKFLESQNVFSLLPVRLPFPTPTTGKHQTFPSDIFILLIDCVTTVFHSRCKWALQANRYSSLCIFALVPPPQKKSLTKDVVRDRNSMRRSALRAAISASRAASTKPQVLGIATSFAAPCAARVAVPASIRCFSQTLRVAEDWSQNSSGAPGAGEYTPARPPALSNRAHVFVCSL